jgi:hypothetical protein
MGGGHGHLAVMADIERALGRPERALELSRGPDVRELEQAERIELAIVAAGARRDLGELDAAVVSLQIPELDPARRDPWSARLFYAYADNLLAAGRESDALQWFVHAADADDDGETDAARRLAELTGEPLPDDDVAFDIEDEHPADPNDPDVALPGTDHPESASPEPAGSATDGTEPGERSGAGGSEVADSEVGSSESAGLESAGLESAGADTAGADTAGADTAGADTAGADTAGDASGPGQPDRGAAGEREPGASG